MPSSSYSSLASSSEPAVPPGVPSLRTAQVRLAGAASPLARAAVALPREEDRAEAQALLGRLAVLVEGLEALESRIVNGPDGDRRVWSRRRLEELVDGAAGTSPESERRRRPEEGRDAGAGSR